MEDLPDGYTALYFKFAAQEGLSAAITPLLENGADVPYVARLQEIFVYSFASSEVYFNARWYYREGDVHEYAKMAGASGKVKYEGGTLTAAPSASAIAPSAIARSPASARK